MAPKTATGRIGGGDKRGRFRESKVTVGTSVVPFARASTTKGRAAQTGERSGQNRDSIQSSGKQSVTKSKRATPKTVGY